MMHHFILRHFQRISTACVALSFAACTNEGSELPPVTFLSPEDANHAGVQWSHDGKWVTYWEPTASGWHAVLADEDLVQVRVLTSFPALLGAIPPTVWSPDGSLLAYAANDENSLLDVAILDMATGETRQITQGGGWEVPIEWHPAGDRLAYVAMLEGGTLQKKMIGLDGRASAPFPDAGSGFQISWWSPDGSRIAYQMTDSAGLNTIWLADSAGENATQLTTEGFEALGQQPWSPDGTELLYLSTRTGADDIFVLPIDGSPPRQLTRDVRRDRSPRWSPDGEWVAFISERGRQTDVWIVPAAGGAELRVTDDEAIEQDLRWPEGNRVAFTTLTRTDGLWAVSLADGSERRLTPDSIPTVGSFEVSNDRTRVAVMINWGGGVQDLAIVSVDGGAVRTLVADGSWNWYPRWSPDDSEIAFLSTRSGNWDVWVVDAAGGTPRQLTDWPSNETGPPEWTADGSAVHFLSPRNMSSSTAGFGADLWVVPASGGEPRRLTTSGTVAEMVASPYTPDVFVTMYGGAGGGFYLSRLLPDGSLQVLWDRTAVMDIWREGIMPSGDSIVVDVERLDGTPGSVLVPVRGGDGRWLLEEGEPRLADVESAGGWSSDGSRLAFRAGVGEGDIAVLSLQDGSKRRLTQSASYDAIPRFTAGDEHIVFRRQAERRRIATADVGKLIQGGN